MNPYQIVNKLLGAKDWPQQLIGEASVHRPRRGRIWVASFTGPSGQQWRSTGTVNHGIALAIAQKLEADARTQRANSEFNNMRQKTGVRQTAGGPGGGLTQREVALLLGLSERAVRAIEKRALRKLAQHPRLQEIWRQFLAGELTEDGQQLSGAELKAFLGLARTRAELEALRKVLQLSRTAHMGPSFSNRKRLNFQNEPIKSP